MALQDRISFENQENVGTQIGHQAFHGTSYHIAFGKAGPNATTKDKAALLKKLDDALLASLAFPQMFDRRSTIESPHPSTCRWILEHHDFCKWRQSDSGLLWIKGKPGSGKSTLLLFIYKQLKQNYQTKSDVYLEFFFSARGASLQRTPLGMLRSLINQLFNQDPSVRHYVRDTFLEKRAAFGSNTSNLTWNLQELEACLREAICISALNRKINIFVDALDEAGDEDARRVASLFHTINQVVVSESRTAKICLSCRHYPIPSNVKATEIRMELHNKNDIERYIHDRIGVHTVDENDNEDSRSWLDVEQELVRRSNGIFQWAHLIVPRVEKCMAQGDSPARVRTWLNDVPQELGDVYEHILRHVVDVELRRSALLLFAWTLYTERTLSLNEMRFALAANEIFQGERSVAISQTTEFIVSEARMVKRVNVLSGGLLEASLTKNRKGRVQAIHETVHDFLIKKGLRILIDMNRAVPEGLRPLDANCDDVSVDDLCHMLIHHCCLNYLAGTDQSELLDRGTDRRELLHEFPLLGYAAVNLFSHFRDNIKYDDGNTKLYTTKLQNIFPRWTIIYSYFSSYSFMFPCAGSTVLHAVANFRMAQAAASLVQQGASVNIKDGNGNSPLHIACFMNNEAVAQLLLDHGADAYAENNARKNAMSIASAYAGPGLTNLLLAATPSFWDSYRGSDLRIAAANGNTTLVQTLIEQLADSSANGLAKETALQRAASGGHSVVVQLLLRARADPNKCDPLEGSPLLQACRKGHIDVAQQLLDAGAHINTPVACWKTVSHPAASTSHMQILRKLSEMGDEEGGLLHLAAYKGRDSIVELLIANGASAEMSHGFHGTPLEAASYGGHEQIVQKLLEAGAKVKALADSYDNPLKIASARGFGNIVDKLIRSKGFVCNEIGVCAAIKAAVSARRNQLTDVPFWWTEPQTSGNEKEAHDQSAVQYDDIISMLKPLLNAHAAEAIDQWIHSSDASHRDYERSSIRAHDNRLEIELWVADVDENGMTEMNVATVYLG